MRLDTRQQAELDKRSAYGGSAVRAGTPDYGLNGDDDEIDVADALVNIMHFCDRRLGYATLFDLALDKARVHFEAERGGDL